MARILRRPWHEEFFACISPYTDAPDNFITWSALSLIGATLKSNVCYELATYIVYPNLYIVLVAPPGIGKGTALHIVDEMINETGPNNVVNVLSYRNTTESILIDIENGWTQAPKMVGMQITVTQPEHSCLFLSTEIRTLLGSSDWILEFLEEAWSETKYKSRTKNKGHVEIKDMCFSLLAASVPDFLQQVGREYNSKMVITGGFSSRCIFVHSQKPSKDLSLNTPSLKSNPKAKALYDSLVADLKEISLLKGKFIADADARILCENFLKENRIAAEDEYSEAVINARARAKANVIKLAMVFSVSRGDSLVINRIDMLNAISVIKDLFLNLTKLFRGAGDSLDAPKIARVQQFIEKNNYGVKRNEILRALVRHITNDDLDRILWVLESIGWCTKIERNRLTWYTAVPQTPQQKAVGLNGKVGP